MTFVSDACRQYTLAEGVLAEMERVAHERGVKITGYPTFVVLTQPYMYGNLFYSPFREVPDQGEVSDLPKDGIEVGMTLFGPVDRRLRRFGKRDEPALLKHLFEADGEALAAHREAFKNRRRLRALSQEVLTPTGSAVADSTGLFDVITQDPAVFSPFPISLEVIRKAFEEHGLPTDGFDDARVRARTTFLEVSDWSPGTNHGSVEAHHG